VLRLCHVASIFCRAVSGLRQVGRVDEKQRVGRIVRVEETMRIGAAVIDLSLLPRRM
jgi:hypothetical protein